jgi:L-methionine (R)-S-oxide reductase
MEFVPQHYDFSNKEAAYRQLAGELRGLLRDEPDLIANAANTVALLFHALPDINWAGFYFLRHGAAHEELVVGPFQGKPACVRIPLGKGVCGSAAAQRTTLVVPDVHAFPGHIACDAESRSEIVIPLLSAERLLGVLDIDSPRPDRFDAADRSGLEELVAIFVRNAR